MVAIAGAVRHRKADIRGGGGHGGQGSARGDDGASVQLHLVLPYFCRECGDRRGKAPEARRNAWCGPGRRGKSAAMNDLETRKNRARAWFETLRDRIMAAFEALEDEAPAALYPGAAGRFEKTPWHAPRRRRRKTGRRRRHGHDARPAVREGGRAHLHRVRRFSPDFAKQVKGAAEDPALLGQRHQPDRPYEEPARAGGAHEHPHDRDHAKAGSAAAPTSTPRWTLARTARHPDTVDFHARLKKACDGFDGDWYPQIQEMGRQLFLAAASRRAARRGRHLL